METDFLVKNTRDTTETIAHERQKEQYDQSEVT